MAFAKVRHDSVNRKTDEADSEEWKDDADEWEWRIGCDTDGQNRPENTEGSYEDAPSHPGCMGN